MFLQDARRHHRRERECDERADHDAARDRDGEFDEEPAGGAGLERERREHRDERKRDGDDGEGDFIHALERRLHRGHAVLDVTMDVFQHHDGVVHDHADGQHEREHGEDVDGVTERHQDRERADDGNRDGDGRNERRAEAAEEEPDDDDDEREGDPERFPDLADRLPDEDRFVVVEDHLNAIRQSRLDALNLGLDAIGDLDGVRLRLFHDAEEDAWAPVVSGDGAFVLHAGAGFADVAQTHQLGGIVPDDEVVELVRRLHFAASLDSHLALEIFDATARQLDVLLL